MKIFLKIDRKSEDEIPMARLPTLIIWVKFAKSSGSFLEPKRREADSFKSRYACGYSGNLIQFLLLENISLLKHGDIFARAWAIFYSYLFFSSSFSFLFLLVGIFVPIVWNILDNFVSMFLILLHKFFATENLDR